MDKHLDMTPPTPEGWRTDAHGLRAIANDIDKGRVSDWCNTEWLRAVALKIDAHADAIAASVTTS